MRLPSLIGHVTELYDDILRSGRPADRCIDQFFRSRGYLGSTDRRFIAENVYGMLRHRTLITWMMERAAVPEESRFACIAHLFLSRTSDPARIAEELQLPVEPLLLLQRTLQEIPQSGDDVAALSLRFSYPDWMIGAWIQQYGPAATEQLCAVMNTPAPMTIRVNTIRTTREALTEELAANGIDAAPTALSPFGLILKKRVNLFQLQAFRDGRFEVQDEGSQLLALVADPKPGSKVVDACAGAGGKALAMACTMKNKGEIFALDVHTYRLEELQKRVKRNGVDTIRTKAIQEGERVERLSGAADVVLVDAPCSGTGTIRRNPGMKWTITEQTVTELHEKQSSILDLNAGYVKPGGRLVYATCSLMRYENERVTERFLASHPEFQAVSAAGTLERYGLAHLASEGYFQLMPHRYDTDGFFAAVMHRRP